MKVFLIKQKSVGLKNVFVKSRGGYRNVLILNLVTSYLITFSYWCMVFVGAFTFCTSKIALREACIAAVALSITIKQQN